MTSLAQRLQKIQKTTEESRSDQQQLSLGQLREQKISFGKTHQGKTFLKMWKEEQGWITWFVQRFAQSTKIEHQSFLRYVELEIEQAELFGNKQINMNSAPTQSSQMNSGAQCQEKHPTHHVPEISVWDEEEDADFFEMITTETGEAPNQQTERLETRVLKLEVMLNNINLHLQNLVVNRNNEQ